MKARWAIVKTALLLQGSLFWRATMTDKGWIKRREAA